MYSGFNVLTVKDKPLYSKFKEYSNFTTFPQVFVNGNIVGGVDICKELLETGELQTVRCLIIS